MDFTSPDGEQRYAALVAVAAETVIALDFDGTLSPIVDDPTQAHIHPDAAATLIALAGQVKAIAVVTGRPARQAIALGGLEDVADALAAQGKGLYVYGQYGNERWSSERRSITAPRPPHGLATFMRELPRALRDAGVPDAYVEDKGLAVAVHTRRLPDPTASYERLVPPLRDLAERNGLVIEPGRHVLEIRAGGMHKGLVVETLVADLGAGGFVFAGDDLGDVEAFDAVAALGKDGMPTVLVCASAEQAALVPLADVVVDGPDGVLGFLRRLTADAQR
jgi:trehalose 6-phosphate phosphatase